ncbi:MAG: hypothetical protein GX754_12025 [Clostridiaceae bacterium]|nr:hypothetical protein [Clostridiaceae bacterium]
MTQVLGDKWVFGSRLQYFIKSGDIELGCIQFFNLGMVIGRERQVDRMGKGRQERLNVSIKLWKANMG